MENPKYFPQCDLCSQYNVDSILGKMNVESIRENIKKRIEVIEENNCPETERFWGKYYRCEECMDNRLKEVEKEKKEKVRKKDIEFLTSIGIKQEEKEIDRDRKFLDSIGIKPESAL